LLGALTIISAGIYAIQVAPNVLWSVRGQMMMAVAKDEWTQGRFLEASEHWWSAIRLTLNDTLNREMSQGYLRQSDDLLQQGRLMDALNACHTAAKFYDEEGATSYQCLEIEQQLTGTSTPFPAPSPTPTRTSRP